jgi:putative ABC transport system permease protein
MKVVLLVPLLFGRLLYQSMYLALCQIWANKMRSILTTIGIIIGVASVSAVIAALTGLKDKIESQVETFGTNTLVIQPKINREGVNEFTALWTVRFLPEHFDGLLEHCPSVRHLSRIAGIGIVGASHADRSSDNVELIGVESAYHEILHRPVVQGRELSLIDNEQARQVCIIDERLKDELRLDRDCIGQTIRIQHFAFVVVGVIEPQARTSFGEGAEQPFQVLIPYRTSFKMGKPFTLALAASKSTELTEEAQAEIRFFLRRVRNIRPGEPDTFRVAAVQSYLETFRKIMFVVTVVAGGIVGISLLVGGVGIMNIMLVSVSERTREIGLRKAVGARQSAILTQFLIESVVLCFVGGLVGLGFGQFLTLIIRKIPRVELHMAHIPVWAVLLSFGFAGLVGIVFGMFPAIKAARLDPIEALRHE